jgi:hypothetical protein
MRGDRRHMSCSALLALGLVPSAPRRAVNGMRRKRNRPTNVILGLVPRTHRAKYSTSKLRFSPSNPGSSAQGRG